MNTDSGKPTITIPHNQPVSMRRVPQLGDTLVVHGGERPAGPDAPSVDAPTAKGLSPAETAAEDEGLLGSLGGPEGATSDSAKIFADTPPASLYGIIGDAPTLSEHHLAWVSPEGEKCWLVHEPDAGVTVYDVFTAAQARVNESEGRASFCVPRPLRSSAESAIPLPGWAPAPLEGFESFYVPEDGGEATDVASDTDQAPGADAPRDTKSAGDGSLA